MWPPSAVLLLLISSLPVFGISARKHQKSPKQIEEDLELPTQIQANCPTSCRCNKTTIICNNGGFKHTEIFLQIKDQFYPNLDTLAISGNQFRELEADNLFGPDVKHDRLTRVVLVNNDISVIHAKAFEAISKVEELDLSYNNVSSIHGDLFTVRYGYYKVIRLL